MKRWIFIVLILIPSICYSQLVWDTKMNQEIVDLRSFAMGKTSIVSPRGSNAMFSNPALLGKLEARQFTVGGRLFFGSIDDARYSESSYYQVYSEEYPAQFKFSSLSFAMPINTSDSNLRISAGIGYNTFFDYSMVKEMVKETNNERSTSNDDFSGGVNVFSPSLSISYKNKHSIGITFNKTVSGKTTFVSESESVDFSNKYETIMNHSAYFVIIGGYFEVTPKLNAAFMIRPSFNLDFGEITYAQYTYGVEIHSSKSEAGQFYIPEDYGIGIEYNVKDHLTIAGEIHHLGFSSYRHELNNGQYFRLGVESRKYKIPLRIGLFMDDLPITDNEDDDPRPLSGITGGTGYTIFNKLTIDAAFQWSAWEFKNYSDYKYSESLFTFRMSAQYEF